MRPSSSPLQNAKRTRFSGSMPSSAICSAVSRIVAVPEPLSLMPGPSRDRVEVAADDDGAVGATGRGVGEEVLGGDLLDRRSRRLRRSSRPGVVAHSAPRANGALTTGMRAHRRVERAAEQAEAVVAGDDVALVEDDDAAGAGRGGVVGLDREVARAALDEGDVAGGEAGEVGRLAAARRGAVAGEVDVDAVTGAVTSPSPEKSIGK